MNDFPPKPRPPKRKLSIYVDGANLYWGLHEAAKRQLLWLDLVELAMQIRPESQLVKVRYFTTIVIGEPSAQSRQAHYISALQAKNPHVLSVHQGRYQKKDIQCNECEAIWVQREEKETDVNIAVALVADAARGLMDDALIISADSDLSPAVHTAQELRSGLFVGAAFPPARFSSELKRLMPASFQISAARIARAQLPDAFEVNGRKFRRPDKWR